MDTGLEPWEMVYESVLFTTIVCCLSVGISGIKSGNSSALGG